MLFIKMKLSNWHIQVLYVISFGAIFYYLLQINRAHWLLGVFLVLVATVLFYKNPVFLMILYMLTVPVVEQMVSKESYSLANPSVMIKGFILILFIIILLVNKVNIFRNQLTKPLSVLVLLFAITLPITRDIQSGIPTLIKLIHFIVMIAFVRYIFEKNRENIQKIWTAQLVSVFLIIISIIVVTNLLGVSRAEEMYGTGASSGFFYASIAPVIAGNLAIVLLFHQFFPKYKKTSLLLSLFVAFTTLATFQRSAVVILMAQMIICGVIGLIKFKQWTIGKIISYLVIVTAVGSIYLMKYPETLEYRMSNIELEEDINPRYFAGGRLRLWRYALERFEKRSLFSKMFGTGIGSARYYTVPNENVEAHNVPLKFLLEGGIIGLLIYFVFIIMLIKFALRAGAKYPQFLALGFSTTAAIIIASIAGESYFFSTQMHTSAAIVFATIASDLKPIISD